MTEFFGYWGLYRNDLSLNRFRLRTFTAGSFSGPPFPATPTPLSVQLVEWIDPENEDVLFGGGYTWLNPPTVKRVIATSSVVATTPSGGPELIADITGVKFFGLIVPEPPVLGEANTSVVWGILSLE